MDTEVLIAGAGPTGLVLAVDLARRGIRHRLFERSPEGFPGSRGAGIQPRTQELLDDLGVLPALRAAGGPCQRMQTWQGTTRGRVWDLVTPAEPSPAVPCPDLLMVPQYRTVELLHERLVELGGEVGFRTALTDFTQDADGVTATLQHADGATETVRAAYLVAADGGRSTVRRALGVPFTGGPADPLPALVADVVLDGLDRDHWHMWPDAEAGLVALRPLEGTEAFQLAVRFEDAAYEPTTERDATPGALTELLVRRTGWPGLRVTEVRWSSVYRARAAMAERFRAGRVFLAGDAAHVHPPAGGQGLNTSVQDGYNLGWKLGAVLRHGAPAALLDTYDAERVRVAADVLGLASRTHVEDRASHRGLSLRGRETLQLGVNYRESPLARERRGALPEDALRAGDRAPDAPCVDTSGAAVRLFDVFRGPHFTLLDLTGTPAPLSLPEAGWVRAYRVGGAPAGPAGAPELTELSELTDPDGHIKAAYGSGLFLIRPDGYVGLATDDPADVGAYLEAVSGRAVAGQAVTG
ncbi:FAD-dependent monooxygenase [Streptomyces stramineus]|uniref:FAD-dependent monooxygenase n=1 Tax=Streptomyces sp. NPDC046215 TaxID=3155774 RepID=UPI0033E2169E